MGGGLLGNQVGERGPQGGQKSLEIEPSAEAHTFLGWAYSFQARYQDAIRECKRAIALDPEFGNPYNDIGAYLIETGRHADALPWLKKALAAKRYDARCYPHFNMGRVFEELGRWEDALQAYEEALRENPEYHLAWHALNRLKSMLD